MLAGSISILLPDVRRPRSSPPSLAPAHPSQPAEAASTSPDRSPPKSTPPPPAQGTPARGRGPRPLSPPTPTSLWSSGHHLWLSMSPPWKCFSHYTDTSVHTHTHTHTHIHTHPRGGCMVTKTFIKLFKMLAFMYSEVYIKQLHRIFRSLGVLTYYTHETWQGLK